MASMKQLQEDSHQLQRTAQLSSVVGDVDKILDLLVTAREQVASATDDSPYAAGITMNKLQNPVMARFDAINSKLKEVNKGQKVYEKALKHALPSSTLPTEYDAMANQTPLINRAIVMHLLREGQFSVASTFIREAEDNPLSVVDPSMDVDADVDEDGGHGGHGDGANGAADSLASEDLQDKFSAMYSILHELKRHNLLPAIRWARHHSQELEDRGSNLEFELSKLQFIWLFGGPAVNGLPDGAANGLAGALAYARAHFPRFQARHLHEIRRLSCSLTYAANLAGSPYAAAFASAPAAFADVAASFTRDFCSLLGLSAESPLYVAATAGAIAMPQLLRYVEVMRSQRTEWTTVAELPYETPLPRGMMYHSIFVCPVLKGQTTEENPPMMLPCGHVIAKESLQNMAKGPRFKCPYCPIEGHIKDARQIVL